ncbi:Methionine aminopeptidase [Paragonimus heterotremus]|uniref:Methionine aminopeptidase n=1 Tax=Paragonimus heterotremus TaxID=100268 RepID=A0A8J4SP23_9TREM|nr:Methionine aminopeptidase [Paragonimus heterotremus]
MFLKPGLSTQDVDDFVFDRCMSKRVYPSPLGYHGFPKSVCTSVNEVACHGIPSSQQLLLPGDLLSIDISVYTENGVHGDACRSYVLKPEAGYSSGACPSSGRNKLAVFLCSVAKSCRDAGIAICAPGTPYTEIARAVSSTADRNGCRVVAGIRGHGVGTFLHGPPDIIHSVHEISLFSTDESMGQMKEGHVFTIEPCIALAVSNISDQKDGTSLSPACPTILQDGWTVVTSDQTLTAQFEHTIVITSTGHSILT